MDIYVELSDIFTIYVKRRGDDVKLCETQYYSFGMYDTTYRTIDLIRNTPTFTSTGDDVTVFFPWDSHDFTVYTVMPQIDNEIFIKIGVMFGDIISLNQYTDVFFIIAILQVMRATRLLDESLTFSDACLFVNAIKRVEESIFQSHFNRTILRAFFPIILIINNQHTKINDLNTYYHNYDDVLAKNTIIRYIVYEIRNICNKNPENSLAKHFKHQITENIYDKRQTQKQIALQAETYNINGKNLFNFDQLRDHPFLGVPLLKYSPYDVFNEKTKKMGKTDLNIFISNDNNGYFNIKACFKEPRINTPVSVYCDKIYIQLYQKRFEFANKYTDKNCARSFQISFLGSDQETYFEYDGIRLSAAECSALALQYICLIVMNKMIDHAGGSIESVNDINFFIDFIYESNLKYINKIIYLSGLWETAKIYLWHAGRLNTKMFIENEKTDKIIADNNILSINQSNGEIFITGYKIQNKFKEIGTYMQTQRTTTDINVLKRAIFDHIQSKTEKQEINDKIDIFLHAFWSYSLKDPLKISNFLKTIHFEDEHKDFSHLDDTILKLCEEFKQERAAEIKRVIDNYNPNFICTIGSAGMINFDEQSIYEIDDDDFIKKIARSIEFNNFTKYELNYSEHIPILQKNRLINFKIMNIMDNICVFADESAENKNRVDDIVREKYKFNTFRLLKNECNKVFKDILQVKSFAQSIDQSILSSFDLIEINGEVVTIDNLIKIRNKNICDCCFSL